MSMGTEGSRKPCLSWLAQKPPGGTQRIPPSGQPVQSGSLPPQPFYQLKHFPSISTRRPKTTAGPPPTLAFPTHHTRVFDHDKSYFNHESKAVMPCRGFYVLILLRFCLPARPAEKQAMVGNTPQIRSKASSAVAPRTCMCEGLVHVCGDGRLHEAVSVGTSASSLSRSMFGQVF
jgi:hypothetical protein